MTGRERDAPVVGPVPPGADPVAYDRLRRRVLWAMPSGLYVLGSRADSSSHRQRRRNLMTCNWVTQVSTGPKLVAVGVEARAVTRQLLDEGGAFTVSILDRKDRALVRRFVKPVADIVEDAAGRAVTMAGQAVWEGTTGAPVLSAAVAWLECRVHHRLALGSHVLYLGEVVDVGVVAEQTGAAAPMRAGAGAAVPEGVGEDATGGGAPASSALQAVLRMEDTRMSYGG